MHVQYACAESLIVSDAEAGSRYYDSRLRGQAGKLTVACGVYVYSASEDRLTCSAVPKPP